MSRWQVFRLKNPSGDYLWCAMNPKDYWSDSYFDTHTDAINHATRRARTTQVLQNRKEDTVLDYNKLAQELKEINAGVHVTTRYTWADLATELLKRRDLPGPDDCPPDIHKPGWRLAENKYAAVLAGHVHISDRHGWGMSYSPREVREVAYKLLAAADHAEGVRT